MILKTFTLVSSIALVALSAPATPEAAAAGRNGAGSGARPSMSARAQVTSANSRQFAGRGDRWHNRSGRGWSHSPRYYRPRYGAFYYGGYPYYNYPFGYGYGYGYPYFGASAALYYNGYNGSGRARYENEDGGSVVANVQQQLARAGYYRGAIDGVIGNGTRHAIRAYERANGLRVDGRIDSDLLARMGLR